MKKLEKMFKIRCDKIIGLLQELPDDKLDMSSYTSADVESPDAYENFHNCGTTCCVAGLIPVVDMEFAKLFLADDNTFRYQIMSGYYLGTLDRVDVSSFLFSENWCNDRKQAVKRLEHYRDNNNYHPAFINDDGSYNFDLVL